MNENTNPEFTSEETAANETAELNEPESNFAEEELKAEQASESIEENNEDQQTEIAEKTDADQESESIEENNENQQTEITEEPAKKRFPLQVPVIIALCLVVAALLGYLVYTAFFLKEPEGVTWMTEIDGVTYYIDFNNNNTVKAYVGTVEIEGTYEKQKGVAADQTTMIATSDEVNTNNTLTVNAQIAYFSPGYAATYEVTGSRLLGNQELHCTYGQGMDFTFKQAKREKIRLELPQDFTPDEKLLGTWIFRYYDMDIYKLVFNADGSMQYMNNQYGLTYNGTYTISDGQINFTYYVNEPVASPLDYQVNGDVLTCLNVNFVREGSDATPDQMVITPESDATAAAE